MPSAATQPATPEYRSSEPILHWGILQRSCCVRVRFDESVWSRVQERLGHVWQRVCAYRSDPERFKREILGTDAAATDPPLPQSVHWQSQSQSQAQVQAQVQAPSHQVVYAFVDDSQ